MASDRLKQLLTYRNSAPDDPFIPYAIALEYMKSGETEKALEFFEVLIGQHRDYVGTYYHLGKLYEQLDRVDEATETYNKGIAVASQAGDQHTVQELQQALSLITGE